MFPNGSLIVLKDNHELSVLLLLFILFFYFEQHLITIWTMIAEGFLFEVD